MSKIPLCAALAALAFARCDAAVAGTATGASKQVSVTVSAGCTFQSSSSTLSVAAPGVLGIHDLADIDPFHGRLGTVWSWWGMGYLLIPLVLPVLGLVYLSRSRRAATAGAEPA